jgi:hypothetical protein
MPRTQVPQSQLEFREPTAVRWEELPASLRARVRDVLAALLRQAAGRVGAAPEVGDDQ